MLTCELGEVADLSRGGVRIRGSGSAPAKLGDQVSIELCSPTDSMIVQGKVLRVVPGAFNRFEMGIKFDGLSLAQEEMVENLARFGSRRATQVADRAEQLRKLTAALRMPDHYATLGVSPRATASQVQQAYRDLARKYHPDLSKDPESVKKFCAINDANRVLGDPQRRAEYDALVGHAKAA